MTIRLPCSVSLPCGSRSRNWAGSPLVHRRNPRRSLRSVPPRLCLRGPVRSAHAWSRSSSPTATPATGRPCTPAPSNARPSSRQEIERLQALLRLREQQLFGRKTETAAATAPSAPDASHAATAATATRPAARQAGAETPRSFPPPGGRRGSRPSAGRSAAARGAASPSPPSPAPRIPRSWRSRSGPIAGSSAAAVIGPPAAVVPIPASSPPRRRPG